MKKKEHKALFSYIFYIFKYFFTALRLPIITTTYGYAYLYNKFDGKLFSSLITLIEPEPFIYQVSLVLIIIGIVVGMFGSLRAVKKYLKI